MFDRIVFLLLSFQLGDELARNLLSLQVLLCQTPKLSKLISVSEEMLLIWPDFSKKINQNNLTFKTHYRSGDTTALRSLDERLCVFSQQVLEVVMKLYFQSSIELGK
jgi:hypothetical protein